MELVLVSLVLLFLGGAVSVFYKDEPRASSAIGAGSCVAGCLLALIAALRVLFAGRPSTPIRFPSNVPLMDFVLHLDALSAVFLLPILGVSAIAAVYGSQYVLHYPPRAVASIWFFFNLLVGNLILVICAHNAIMFLIAWEVASIAPFFLLAAQHDQPHVRRAAIRYVIAMHIGSAALIAAFLLLAGATNSFDFDALGQSPHHHSSAIFGLLLIGFGMKAGLVPLHVWLPEAHPAAPSHASAVMSGAVINIGVYGIVRFLSLLGGGPLWWSVALIGIGLCTAVFGVLFALGQPELKRLLAYSSIENMGIITASFGL
ncbi:MAG: hypothetical protein IT290_11545, partial [Deltaproteobacteria bacterium]|nr:hypothetical protein [Deltaproteobacteria bacterium]